MSSLSFVDWLGIFLLTCIAPVGYLIWSSLQKKYGHIPTPSRVEFFNTNDGPFNGTGVRPFSASSGDFYPINRRVFGNFQITGGTVYGYSVITPEIMGRYNIRVVATRLDDMDDVILQLDSPVLDRASSQVHARRIHSTTSMVHSIDQIQAMLEDAQKSQRPPERKRTIIWEKGND